MITTIYLTADDYALLSRLPGATLRKRRYPWEENGTPFSIDVFDGVPAGLMLAEAEGATDSAVEAVTLPTCAVCEVTTEPAFHGGTLARLTSTAFHQWQASGFLTGSPIPPPIHQRSG